jgi:hypothetical protein
MPHRYREPVENQLPLRRAGGRKTEPFPSAWFHVTTVYGKENLGNKEKTRAACNWAGHSDWRTLAPS